MEILQNKKKMRDIIYSMSNTVNNIVTTLYGGYMDIWWIYCGAQLATYINVKPLCCISEIRMFILQ